MTSLGEIDAYLWGTVPERIDTLVEKCAAPAWDIRPAIASVYTKNDVGYYWNPALEAQASKRAHRIGQSEPVMIYHLFYKGTVEEIMCERCERRRKMAEAAVPATREADAHDLARALKLSPLP